MNYGDPAGNEFGGRWPDSKIQDGYRSSQDGANPDALFVGEGSAAGLTLGADYVVSVEDAADRIADADLGAAETVAAETVYGVVEVVDAEVVVDDADDS